MNLLLLLHLLQIFSFPFFPFQSYMSNDLLDHMCKEKKRTKERGLVISSWAPRVEVPSHGATRRFLTLCGWNASVESVVHGVPLIAWPLFAENAVTLIEDVKVAL
ncbi:hypothetical protein ACOSQ2_003725 [Xanthoceras sorbifolium]